MYITDDSDIECLRDIILKKKLFRNQGLGVDTQCSLFENNFSKAIGTQFALLLTSGTNALICALKSLEVSSGDEIIIPAFTFIASASAVTHVGATPIITNIDSSLMIDPKEIEKNISSRTKAIIVVHMDGHSCDMDAILEIARMYNLFVIEDVAQAVGGSYKGKRLGSIGDIGCFSFNVDKIISCGEGGAITTNSRLIYERCLANHDSSCSFGATHKESFTLIKPAVGESMRVSEISGALMNNQLKRLDFILSELRLRKTAILKILNENNICEIPCHDFDGDCATSFYLKLKSPELCKQVFIDLNSKNITAIPVSSRPAHVAWQWADFLGLKFKKILFLSSIDLLTSTLKINIPFELQLNQLQEFSENILLSLRSGDNND